VGDGITVLRPIQCHGCGQQFVALERSNWDDVVLTARSIEMIERVFKSPKSHRPVLRRTRR
jgi:hypothetical protein